MHTEIAKLSRCIVEPVAPKLSAEALDAVVDEIRKAFEQLLTERAAPDTDCAAMAVNIIKPIQPMISEKEFGRIADRLRGAMAGFCQGDWSKEQPDPEPERAEASP